MRTHACVLAAVTLLAGTPAFAADPAVPLDSTVGTTTQTAPGVQAAPATPAPANPARVSAEATAPAPVDPVVCHSQPITGSRMGVARVCMKQSEWTARTQNDQRTLQRMEEHAYAPEGH